MSVDSVSRGFSKKPSSIRYSGQGKKLLGERELLRCVGQTIRDARKQNTMTQDCLSEIAGVSAKYLSEVERGRSNVSVLLLLRVSRALEPDLGALLYGCEGTSEDLRVRKELWDQLQKLKPQELRQAVRIPRAIDESEER